MMMPSARPSAKPQDPDMLRVFFFEHFQSFIPVDAVIFALALMLRTL